MLRILFYVEPLIELDRPYWKRAWADKFSRRVVDALGAGQCTFGIVLNEPLAERFQDDRVRTFVFTQEELRAPFGMTAPYRIPIEFWHRGRTPARTLDYFRDLYLERLQGFDPDIIITYSPACHLREIFPRALLLHKEYGIFSRSPFPETWYLDVRGMFDRSYPNTYPHVPPRVPDYDPALVRGLKEHVREVIHAMSPFRGLREALGRDRLVLLPLQFSRYVAFDGVCGWTSQLDYLESVLRELSCGVIVTSHPEHPLFTDEMLEYLRARYPHFIYDRAFEDWYAAGQYLIAEVDAVVTVSSSLGLQTLLWDKPLLARSGVFRFLEAGDRDRILYWLLTRYYVPRDYMENGGWLRNRLNGMLRRKATADLEDFYEPLDEPARIFDHYREKIVPREPRRGTVLTRDRLEQLRRQDLARLEALESENARLEAEVQRLAMELLEARFDPARPASAAGRQR